MYAFYQPGRSVENGRAGVAAETVEVGGEIAFQRSVPYRGVAGYLKGQAMGITDNHYLVAFFKALAPVYRQRFVAYNFPVKLYERVIGAAALSGGVYWLAYGGGLAADKARDYLFAGVDVFLPYRGRGAAAGPVKSIRNVTQAVARRPGLLPVDFAATKSVV